MSHTINSSTHHWLAQQHIPPHLLQQLENNLIQWARHLHNYRHRIDQHAWTHLVDLYHSVIGPVKNLKRLYNYRYTTLPEPVLQARYSHVYPGPDTVHHHVITTTTLSPPEIRHLITYINHNISLLQDFRAHFHNEPYAYQIILDRHHALLNSLQHILYSKATHNNPVISSKDPHKRPTTWEEQLTANNLHPPMLHIWPTSKFKGRDT